MDNKTYKVLMYRSAKDLRVCDYCFKRHPYYRTSRSWKKYRRTQYKPLGLNGGGING